MCATKVTSIPTLMFNLSVDVHSVWLTHRLIPVQHDELVHSHWTEQKFKNKQLKANVTQFSVSTIRFTAPRGVGFYNFEPIPLYTVFQCGPYLGRKSSFLACFYENHSNGGAPLLVYGPTLQHKSNQTYCPYRIHKSKTMVLLFLNQPKYNFLKNIKFASRSKANRLGDVIFHRSCIM